MHLGGKVYHGQFSLSPTKNRLIPSKQGLSQAKVDWKWKQERMMVCLGDGRGAYSVLRDSLMAGSDSCQKQSTQIITCTGQPKTSKVACCSRVRYIHFGKWHQKLRFLSNGVSWEETLRGTKSGSCEECRCCCCSGKSWKKSCRLRAGSVLHFFWCVDTAKCQI